MYSLHVKRFLVWLVVSASNSSIFLPTVLWSQRSSIWWRISGVTGSRGNWLHLPVTELPFVHAKPSRISRGAVDYDRVSGVVYWSQTSAHTSNSWSLGAQPVVDALSWKTTSVMQFLSSWDVGGLAVDWFTGNVYVTETEHQLIAVARYDIHDANMYRVIITSDLHVNTDIALDPYLGYCIVNYITLRYIIVINVSRKLELLCTVSNYKRYRTDVFSAGV